MKYRVVHKRIRRGTETYHPGDTIEPTDSELSAFGDNLERVEEDTISETDSEEDEEICGTLMSDGTICERSVDDCSYHESE